MVGLTRLPGRSCGDLLPAQPFSVLQNTARLCGRLKSCRELVTTARLSPALQDPRTWQEHDFPKIPRQLLKDSGASPKAYRRLRKGMIGSAVAPQRFSDEERKEAGYSCWKDYLLQCSL